MSLPLIRPLGDQALLVRFADQLDDDANVRAVAFADQLRENMPVGALEVDANLISVLVRYDPLVTDFGHLSGEIRLILSLLHDLPQRQPEDHTIDIDYGDKSGPDLEIVAAEIGISPAELISRHSASPLRVLTTGFAPGFVYCGFHAADLVVPRREAVRPSVPAGSILFAAGQTAIAATTIPTGWALIGTTDFRNFEPSRDPPTRLNEGDRLHFRARL